MDTLYYYPLATAELKELLPYLSKYFGITSDHFSFEIISEILKMRERQQKGEQINYNKPIEGEVKYTDFLDVDMDLNLWCDFDFDKFQKLFNRTSNANGIDITVNQHVFDILFIMATIMRRRKIFEDAGIFHYSHTTPYTDIDKFEQQNKRKDLLELYLFLQEIKTTKPQTLKISHPKSRVSISNDNYWLEQVLEEHLKINASDIESKEQAQAELKTYAPLKGRKSTDHDRNVLIYGIYRLFNDQLELERETPNDLCEFIVRYLQFVNKVDTDKDIDNEWIRAQISYMKSRPIAPKFEFLIK